MATKTEMQGLIDGRADGAGNTVATERDLWGFVKDEIYADAAADNQTNQTYTTRAGTMLNYSITLHKQGNGVGIKGTITNTTTSIQGSQNVFTWEDNEFTPKSGLTYLFDAVQGSNKIRCFINNNVLAITSPMNAGVYTIDEFKMYIAQD